MKNIHRKVKGKRADLIFLMTINLTKVPANMMAIRSFKNQALGNTSMSKIMIPPEITTDSEYMATFL